MIVDGKQIAAEILVRTKVRAKALGRAPKVVALVGDTVAEMPPATRSYLAIKGKRATDAGCSFETREIGASLDGADAVIVQLPLPAGSDQKAICDSIPVEKDADVLSGAAREVFARGDAAALMPPVACAIAEIFKRNGVEPRGKQAAIVGSGFLVGQPAALWLTQQGASVMVHGREANLSVALKDADIIVAGAGVPGLIKPEMLKKGVVLIDAATSESNGQIVGDADPACAKVASVFTPVPGGVGPIAVACLFSNAVTLAERAD